MEKGIQVEVEDDKDRIFPINQYQSVGCEIVEPHSLPRADKDTLILGLKEIPTSNEPLSHHHIYFAHIYKGQPHAESVKKQYHSGGGTLYDLEYLVNEQQKRVCAFGFWAGFVGAARLGTFPRFKNGRKNHT